MCALPGRRHRGSLERRRSPLRGARRNPGFHTSTERASEPEQAPDSVEGLDMRLTYRTVSVLAVIAARPGLSNRQISQRGGIADQGQISRLLSRLARLQLIENTGQGQRKGSANAWRLTRHGEAVERTIRHERLPRRRR
jgi:chromosome segregation and condensation protein ScpB